MFSGGVERQLRAAAEAGRAATATSVAARARSGSMRGIGGMVGTERRQYAGRGADEPATARRTAPASASVPAVEAEDATRTRRVRDSARAHVALPG